MRKISFLLLGTSLSLVPQTLNAAECAVTDCSLLGYTDSACPGSGLKCPFGDGWYCGGGAAEDCIKLGYDKDCTGAGESGSGETCNGKYQSCTCDSSYQYTCSGTGYSGGSGTACGGKYTACTCTSGYEWKDGSCKVISPCFNRSNGAHGEVYCCNNAVVGVKTSNMNFYIAMQDLGRMDWASADGQCRGYFFCDGAKGLFPYSDHIQTICGNKKLLNNLLSANGGGQLIDSNYWSSSSPLGYSTYYYVNMSNCQLNAGYGNPSFYVRPVLTSW